MFDYSDMPSLISPSLSECDTATPPPHSSHNLSNGDSLESPLPNPLVGIVPEDINAFNFALHEEKFRSLLYGRDDWGVPMGSPALASVLSLDETEDQRDLEILFRPFASLIHSDLHRTLINWLDRHSCTKDGGFEAGLATGLRKVTSHGNSKLRKHAAVALTNLHCLGRFHAGDAGGCRITWGELIKLDDCTCQHVTIGALHFARRITGIQFN